jgi:hypothetical protein
MAFGVGDAELPLLSPRAPQPSVMLPSAVRYFPADNSQAPPTAACARPLLPVPAPLPAPAPLTTQSVAHRHRILIPLLDKRL